MRTVVSRILFAVLCVMMSAPADGAVRFGVSGVHVLPQGQWDGMSIEARIAVLERRAALAKSMGVALVRLGDTQPVLFSRQEVMSGTYRDWTTADAALRAFVDVGLEVCLTVPELVGAGEIGAYKSFMGSLAERYDGDTDFGLSSSDLNQDFPDINGNGTVNNADWDASAAEKTAWAEANQITQMEVGHAPRRAEQAGELDTGAYASQLQGASTVIRNASDGLKVMLAGTTVDEQGKNDFLGRLAGLGGAVGVFDAANAHVLNSTDDLTLGFASESISRLGTWLEEAGYGDVDVWLGEMAVGNSPAEGDNGPCTDVRCSDRIQGASLVRLTFKAVARGIETLIYAQPLELRGAEVLADRYTTTGLLDIDFCQDGFSRIDCLPG